MNPSENAFYSYLLSESDPLTESDACNAYDNSIDECYSFASVGGPFALMSPSRVLSEVDPTAYRCGFSDWMDSEGYTEVEKYYFTSAQVDEAEEAFIDQARDAAQSEQEDGMSDEELYSIMEKHVEPAAQAVKQFREAFGF